MKLVKALSYFHNVDARHHSKEISCNQNIEHMKNEVECNLTKQKISKIFVKLQDVERRLFAKFAHKGINKERAIEKGSHGQHK